MVLGIAWTRDDTVERLQGTYQLRRQCLKARRQLRDDGVEDPPDGCQRLVRELLEARSSGTPSLGFPPGAISNDVKHRIERDLSRAGTPA
jgi:hypothetical protein